MGYYNSVGVAIKDQEIINLDNDRINSIKIHELLEFAKHFKSYEGNHLFIWENIKWIESYPEIREILNWLNNFVDVDNYYLVRLGESDDDNEIKGDWYDNDFELGYERKLAYNISVNYLPL